MNIHHQGQTQKINNIFCNNNEAYIYVSKNKRKKVGLATVFPDIIRIEALPTEASLYKHS